MSDRKLSAKKSSTDKSSEEDRKLKKIFARPRYAEPRHPILSSLFARHISKMAFGPKKPKWYTPLTSAQLYLFKDIMNYVEIGREALFRFNDFLEALQDFEPSIRREEVLNVLDSMEKNEFEELDYGKFLFLLAYRDNPSEVDDPGEIDKTLSTPIVTHRQCLILSAISYYVLIASPEEIQRYYIANTRKKSTVLHYQMEATRLQGLTPRQMEEKQKRAMHQLGPLFAITGSPYTYPVPFVRCCKKPKLRKEWPNQSSSAPKSSISNEKEPDRSPIAVIKQSQRMRDKVGYKTEENQMFYDIHYGRMPLPQAQIPKEIREKIRKKCTVELKDYITQKSYRAVEEYRDRLKKATVLYNQKSLQSILRKRFPTDAAENYFIEVYERYMPLNIEDVKNFSLCVVPVGYQIKNKQKSLNLDKYAFGSKVS